MEPNKLPITEGSLFQPIEFWSDLVRVLDGRISQLATVYGFGEVSATLVIKKGKVLDVKFSEEVVVRQETEETNDKQV